MRSLILILAGAVAFGPAVAATADPAVPTASSAATLSLSDDQHTVASPDGSIEFQIDVIEGHLNYAVVRDGDTEIVAPSGMGFVLANPTADLREGLEIESTATDSVDETWTPAWGADAQVRNHYNELTVNTLHAATGIRLSVVIRVFDDGFGFRYVFPQQAVLGAFDVMDEFSEFTLPESSIAYFVPSGTDWNADEQHYRSALLPQVAHAQTPITLTEGSDLVMSLHEADLTDYPAMRAYRVADVPGRMYSNLVPLPGGVKAKLDVTDDAFATPWRTITIGRNAGDLAESHLIENLNDPCEICTVDSDGDGIDDTADWIDPGTYVGVWWELQRRATTWTAGPNHGATTERVKEYIDLAVEAGAKYVLAEGWNVNAGGSWTNQDFLTPNADFDLEEVLDYAEQNGVGYVMHNETRGYVDYYEQHLEEIFSTYHDLGVHAIKTGYATRFELGGVNRSHADQEAVRHYQRVIDMAARYEININAHEAIKPTGLARTYPNMMTGEGIAGMEQENYKGANGNPPIQKTILPFTRWIGGPADYTPGIVNPTWDPANLNTRVQSTVANQLALYTLFFSPLQMLADTPENYAGNPIAFEYLKDMPTTWDQSLFPSAVIGEHVVAARRSGDIWYMGAVTNAEDRTVAVPLTFLDEGQAYFAEVYSDAQTTSWQANPALVERTEVIVTSADTLNMSMVAGGGQALKLTPATPEQIEETPALADGSLEFSDDLDYRVIDGYLEISGSIVNAGAVIAAADVYLRDVEMSPKVVRVGPQEEVAFELRVKIGDLVMDEFQHLVVIDTQGNELAEVPMAVLEFPDASWLGELSALVESNDLDPGVAALMEIQINEAIAAASEYDRVGLTRALQSLRLSYVAVGYDYASEAAGDLVEGWLTTWLPKPYAAFLALDELRKVEADQALHSAILDDLRQAALDVTRAKIRQDGDSFDDALATLRQLAPAVPATYGTLRAALNSQTMEPKLVEAEAGALTGGTRVNAEHPGYTGTGFVRDLTKVDACVTWAEDVVPAGDYSISFRFANGMVVEPLDRTLTASAGGESQRVLFPNQSLSLDDPQRWRRWASTDPIAITHVPGQPLSLCFQEGDSGNINFDSITLTSRFDVVTRDNVVANPQVDLTVSSESEMSDAGWYNAEVNIDVTTETEDTLVQWRTDDGVWATGSEATVELTTDGTHVVHARAVAQDEVSPTVTRTVRIDQTAPVSRAVFNRDSRQVSLAAADQGAGLDYIEYRLIGDDEFAEYTDPVSVTAAAGAIVVRSVDLAGNIEDEYTVTFPAADDQGAATLLSASTRNAQIPFGATAQVDVKVQAEALIPTGQVALVDTNTSEVLANATLTDGKAVLSYDPAAVGSYEWTVVYEGDTEFQGSQDDVALTVVRAASELSVTTDATSIPVGTGFKATVELDGAGVAAGDKVLITADGTQVAEVSVDEAGRAEVALTSAALPVGTVAIAAEFVGSDNAEPAVASTTLRVTQPVTATSVSLSGPTSMVAMGDAPIYRVTVARADRATAQGRVELLVNDTVVAAPALTGGAVSIPLRDSSIFQAGTVRVTARYLGATDAQASQTRQPLSLTITKARPKTVKVKVKAKKVRRGKAVVVRVRVGKLNNGRVLSGQVVLRANGKRVGKATVSSAKATTVKIKLKPKHTRKKNVKLRARFVPTDKSTVKALKSKVKKVKVRR